MHTSRRCAALIPRPTRAAAPLSSLPCRLLPPHSSTRAHLDDVDLAQALDDDGVVRHLDGAVVDGARKQPRAARQQGARGDERGRRDRVGDGDPEQEGVARQRAEPRDAGQLDGHERQAAAVGARVHDRGKREGREAERRVDAHARLGLVPHGRGRRRGRGGRGGVAGAARRRRRRLEQRALLLELPRAELGARELGARDKHEERHRAERHPRKEQAQPRERLDVEADADAIRGAQLQRARGDARAVGGADAVLLLVAARGSLELCHLEAALHKRASHCLTMSAADGSSPRRGSATRRARCDTLCRTSATTSAYYMSKYDLLDHSYHYCGVKLCGKPSRCTVHACNRWR